MGTVYLAEQHEPIRRCVALKVIKLEMEARQVLARFANERRNALHERADLAVEFMALQAKRSNTQFLFRSPLLVVREK